MLKGELLLKANVFFRKGYAHMSNMLGHNNSAVKDLVASNKIMSEATPIDLMRCIRRETPTSIWNEFKPLCKTKLQGKNYTEATEFVLENNFGVNSISDLIKTEQWCNGNQTVKSFIKGLFKYAW